MRIVLGLMIFGFSTILLGKDRVNQAWEPYRQSFNAYRASQGLPPYQPGGYNNYRGYSSGHPRDDFRSGYSSGHSRDGYRSGYSSYLPSGHPRDDYGGYRPYYPSYRSGAELRPVQTAPVIRNIAPSYVSEQWSQPTTEDPIEFTQENEAPVALLFINVPEDAVIYAVGKRVGSTGRNRKFKIPLKEPGDYPYPIRVEVTRGNTTLTLEKVVLVSSKKPVILDLIESNDSTMELVIRGHAPLIRQEPTYEIVKPK